MRSLGNCVAWAVVQHLMSRRKSPKLTTVSGERSSAGVAAFFTPDDLAKLEAKALEQRRSLSRYVTPVVLERLGRG